MTVHFGGCDDRRVNCLPFMEWVELHLADIPGGSGDPRRQLDIPHDRIHRLIAGPVRIPSPGMAEVSANGRFRTFRR
jgi:hypothetical protein